mgnify:CR=1 FL=1
MNRHQIHLAPYCQQNLAKKSKGYVKTSSLILLAFATAYFPRLLESIGFPSPINFVHFVTIPFACWVSVTKSCSKDHQQIIASWMIFYGLGILILVMFTSAFVNDAGLINIIVDFLLIGEPFVLILTMACVPMNSKRVAWFRKWLIRFGFCNLVWATGQYILFMVLGMHPKSGNPDYIQGVFYHSGGGHVVSASVSLTFGLYYCISEKNAPLWKRVTPLIWGIWQMLVADAKQVLLVFLIAGCLLLIRKLKNIAEGIKYIIGSFTLISIFLWCVNNIPAFGAFNTWARPEIYGPEGEATLLKTASIRIIASYKTNLLQEFFGLGPGHTVGRLGGWMIREYHHLLGPLGATSHPVASETWAAVGASWLGDQSSMFSPFWGWAAIWGDLGWLGVATYLFLAVIIWIYFCKDDISKFILLTVGVFGLIFTQMEEPGYMLFVAMIIMIRWHEYRIHLKFRS